MHANDSLSTMLIKYDDRSSGMKIVDRLPGKQSDAMEPGWESFQRAFEVVPSGTKKDGAGCTS